MSKRKREEIKKRLSESVAPPRKRTPNALDHILKDYDDGKPLYPNSAKHLTSENQADHFRSTQDRTPISQDHFRSRLDHTENSPDQPVNRSNFATKVSDQLNINIDSGHPVQIDTGVNLIPVSKNTVPNLIPVSNRDRYPTQAPSNQQQSTNYSDPDSHYFKIPNSLADHLLSILDGSEFKVYFRLFRLSHGFRQTTCFVGYTSLATACNLSLTQIKRVIPSLVNKGLINLVKVINTKIQKGTVYEVNTSIFVATTTESKLTPVSNIDRCQFDTGVKLGPIKDILDDQEINTDHDHHLKTVMTTYKNITGNEWTKKDLETYKRIKHVDPDKIGAAMFATSQRARKRPLSLAYFVNEILALEKRTPETNARVSTKQIEDRIFQIASMLWFTNREKDGQESREAWEARVSKLIKETCLKEGLKGDEITFDRLIWQAREDQ